MLNKNTVDVSTEESSKIPNEKSFDYDNLYHNNELNRIFFMCQLDESDKKYLNQIYNALAGACFHLCSPDKIQNCKEKNMAFEKIREAFSLLERAMMTNDKYHQKTLITNSSSI